MSVESTNPLDHLIQILGRLPSVGSRSARRIALHLLEDKQGRMRSLGHALERAADEIEKCPDCGNLDTLSPCRICQSEKRDRTQMCVVCGVGDIWAIERTKTYYGLYHILGGVLSALDGVGPHDLTIDKLVRRLEHQDNQVQEIILALPATVDGQSTAHYISDALHDKNVTVTKLARGVPMGGELDYLDDGTIATAFQSRR